MMNKFKKVLLIALTLTLLFPAFGATAAKHEPTVSTPAAELRVTLNQLLGEHAYLAIIAMQKGIDGSADFDTAAGALMRNAEELSAAIASIYGEAAGDAFETMWKGHIGYFVDYVVATANNNEAGRQAALDELAEYRKDFSEFLAGANPNLEASALASGLQVHVNQLIAAFDSYVNEDYEQVYTNLRGAYAHMFATGGGLSAAIVAQFPDKFDNTSTSTPAVELRVALDQLLSEHANLGVLAMQKGIDGAPDFNAAAGALMANAEDLSAAIASVYGEAAGDAFETMWKGHIGYFVDYVLATANDNEAGRQAALDELDEYRKDFSEFLAGANPNLDASALASGLHVHVNQLITAFDSYVGGNFEVTYTNINHAYSHMFATGGGLSAAIVAQFPEKFGGEKATVVWLQVGNETLKINDKTIMMDEAPFIIDDRSYLSLRFISEGLGAEVEWDAVKKQVTVKWGDNTALYWIGADYMEYNGERKEIHTEVFIRDGRTQVPVRFFAELMGWNVAYTASDESITLSSSAFTSDGSHHGSMDMDEDVDGVAETVTINIADFKFSSAAITIKKGTTVVFKNMDEAIHTATADDGSFDTGNIQPDATKSVTFNNVGEFSYHCHPHPFMEGTITVTE